MKYTIGFILCLVSTTIKSEYALVIAPVADLIGQPLAGYFSDASSLDNYKQLPLAGGNTAPYTSCPRMHQLLFNDVVNVIKLHKDEVLVEIKQVFYITDKNKTPHTRYWMHKNNIILFSTLKKHHINLQQIPTTLNFTHKSTFNQHNVVTLKLPFFDSMTKKTYSAGTRFIKKNNHVFIFDPLMKKMKKTKIPNSYLVKKTTTHEQQIKEFVATLKLWANKSNGFIPYVWGGTSFIHASIDNDLIEKKYVYKNKKQSFFTRKDDCSFPKSGMDCAGLIIRCAQLNGIPFCFKNSTTIATFLSPLKKGEKLIEGDIIWVRGHVMVVADMKKNTLIEARAYNHGYGKVHEIALNKVFKNITNYHDLKNSYFNKKPLRRIDKQGKLRDTFAEIKLLKLASVWR